MSLESAGPGLADYQDDAKRILQEAEDDSYTPELALLRAINDDFESRGLLGDGVSLDATGRCAAP